MKAFLSLCALSLLLLCGCASNPVTGKSELQLISEQQEIAMGTDYYETQIQIQGGDYVSDPELTAYVQRIGQRVAAESDRPNLPYEFRIINDSSWNAWAMPGGKIAINRGLLEGMRNEGELAAVLAHEVVHAAARHSAKRLERGLLLQAGVLGATGFADSDDRLLVYGLGSTAVGLEQLRHSRSAEREADHYGIVYMHKAGYDPTGAITLQELFAEHHDSSGGWLATHPSSISRVQANRESRDQVGGEEGYLGEAEYRIYTRKLRKQAPAYQKIELGLKALQAGDAEEALRKSLDARNLAPEEAHGIALSAKAYEKMGNRKAALEAWDQAVERNPGWFLPWLERAMMREKTGDRVGALSDYKRSAAILETELAQQGIRRLSK